MDMETMYKPGPCNAPAKTGRPQELLVSDTTVDMLGKSCLAHFLASRLRIAFARTAIEDVIC